ncbi:hypothetical protein ABZ470_20720 [Streptosporangium sp. NPDC020072]|uniref:nSTAND1 domain-containing NTPase n=1 Tax=Streptosporangium sp. NPDC020072 TaxID=3154788 RepID=UPI00343F9A71
MGRSETPLDPTAGVVQRFAYELRKLRQEAGGPTYREMADRAGYSVSVLSRAASGQRLASWPVVEAYVRACGGDVADWRTRWRQAAEEHASPAAGEEERAAPYQGLTHYDVGDRDRFFGRQRLLDQVTGMLERRRLAAVFGPSGSGKSSLLRAGLIPAARYGALGEPVPAVVTLTPGAHPMREHAGTFTAFTGGELVVVDQFEELFTLCSDVAERVAFIDLLLATAGPGGGRVVLAVRADFFGRCAEHSTLAEALQGSTVLVGPMNRQELREAIVKPAAAAGLIVERALTDRIIEDVAGEAGGLPLMSHALLETWRRRRGTLLTLEGYERAGGVHGAIAATAEQVYTHLSPEQADQAKRVLLRLVSPGEQAADTRCPVSYEDFDHVAHPEGVLERLARVRLVTLHDDHVELTHEALITSWPRLRAWIDQERELLRLRRRLGEAAALWNEHGRDAGVLYRGTRLTAAKPLLSHPDDLTVAEQAFLRASVQAAESADRATARRRRLARLAVAALAVLAIVASGAAVSAVAAARQVDARGREILAQLVAKRSDELAATDPALSGLLAAASWRFASTAEARYDMLTMLTGSLDGVLRNPTGAVTTVVFSPDGRLLATAGADGSVQLWQFASHQLVSTLFVGPARYGAVLTMAFSPDGRLLATAGVGEDVRLWEVATRRLVGTLPTSHTTVVTTMQFSRDGVRLNTADDEGGVQVWDVVARRPVATLPITSARGAVMVAFSPDGTTVSASYLDGARVQRWDLATRRMKGPMFDGDVGMSPRVRFSADGAVAATFGMASPSVRLWDAATGSPVGRPLPTGYTGDLALSSDGAMLAVVDEGGRRIRLWDARTQRPVGVPLSGHTGPIANIAFSPSGGILASVSDDGTIRLWNTATFHEISGLPSGHTLDVTAVAFSPDSRLLVSGGTDKTFRLWDVTTRHLSGSPVTGSASGIATLAFSPDGRLLATSGSDANVHLWDAVTRQPVGALALGNSESVVNSVAFSPDGRLLAAGNWRGVIRLWDVASHLPVGAPLVRGSRPVNSVAFSPDGRLLAAGNWRGVIQLWDVASQLPVGAPLEGHNGPVNSVAFSPDGRLLATGGQDRTIRLWDMVTRLPVGAPLEGHNGPVNSVAFSPDGRLLATGGEDRTIRLWDMATRRPIGTPLSGHSRAVRTVAFSPDGRLLATGGEDRTIRLWKTELPPDPPAAVCAAVGRSLTRQEWQQYVPGESYQQICP